MAHTIHNWGKLFSQIWLVRCLYENSSTGIANDIWSEKGRERGVNSGWHQSYDTLKRRIHGLFESGHFRPLGRKGCKYCGGTLHAINQKRPHNTGQFSLITELWFSECCAYGALSGPIFFHVLPPCLYDIFYKDTLLRSWSRKVHLSGVKTPGAQSYGPWTRSVSTTFRVPHLCNHCE